MTMMISLNTAGANGMIAGSTSSTGRAFGRPSSNSNSPERKPKTIRRSQSATMSMNSLAQFRDMTIRPVPQDTSDDETRSKDSHPRSALSTPPRTPNQDVYKSEPRMNQFPLTTRNATFAPTSHPQQLSNEKTIEYRTRARAVPHSPSSSTDEADAAAIATPLNEISLNTSFQALRGRPYAQGASPHQNAPSSPIPNSASVMSGSNAQISTTIYASNGTPQQRTTASKTSNNAKLLKQRTIKKESSNGNLQSIRTSESLSNLRPGQGGDANKVLSLMKELQGKMEGNLEYRIGDGMTWTRGFCKIQEDTGRLTHIKDDKNKITVIGDLRGCQIRTNAKSDEYEGIIEVSTFSSRQDVKIRPLSAHHYDRWIAALLCWQPIRPAGPNNKKVKTQPVKLSTDRKVDRRRNSDATVLKEAAIIKVGKMMLWDRSGYGINTQSASASKDKIPKSTKAIGPTWRKISCILQENGEFKLYNETDVALLHIITLSSLSRSSIQYLDPSVLGMEYCIGIYPHASTNTRFQAGTPPIYLALDTKILFEVWFVLLRAYTVPELYGPAGALGLGSTSSTASPQTPSVVQNFDFGASALTDAFRVPRLLTMKIVEAKLPGLQTPLDEHRHHQFGDKKDIEFFFELFIDGDIRARSPPRLKAPVCMWMETFEFNELPAQFNVIEVVLKQRSVKHRRDRGPTSSNGPLSTYQIITGEAIGVVTINLNDLVFDTESETWWPIIPVSKAQDAPLGEVMLKLRKEELVVLMMEEYKPLLELLLNFSNGLTILISQIVNTDLRRLAHTLLKIFQVSGKAVDWLMALAEADVSGIYKDSGFKSLPHTGPYAELDVQLNQANPDPAIKSDSTKRAQMEANILFRGNSLLTKAVEAHMGRYGREYMEDTIGQHVKRIAEEDIYCEVDPMKCKNLDEIKQNWKTLNSLVRTVWGSICNSGHKCPFEVKKVLYHIRMCVEEKFGGIISGPTYSSVSGFLFLRFFCPAIMNPKMFGLLKDHPGTRAQRTLTLVAKSLQGLANMTTFGVKEPWFEPMNEFLVEHNGEFKRYIDSVSASPPEITTFQVPPSYATPITIQARLQQGSKEGFPSLPFLIDQPRAIGRFVQMWLKWHGLQEAKGGSLSHPKVAGNPTVLKFHELCLHLQERMAICIERAEDAGRPESSLATGWEAVAESVTSSSSSTGAVWDGNSKESTIGSGYSFVSSTPTITVPTIRNTSPGGGANYSRSASATNYKNGNAPPAGYYEDDHDLANIAQLGKTKIVELVGGIKKKVQAAKDSH